MAFDNEVNDNNKKTPPKNPIKFNITLSQEQKEAKAKILERPFSFIIGQQGSGKTLTACQIGLDLVFKKEKSKIIISRPTVGTEDNGFLPGPQPLTAKILTPTGWTTMGALSIGDEVIAWDGTATKVKNIFQKGIKEVYKITTTDGSSTECCEDHYWYTYTAENRKRKTPGDVKSTAEIIDTLLNHKNKLNHFLPRNLPVQFLKRTDIKISPYTLGALLGDGSISNTISLSSTDPEILDRVNKELELIGSKLSTPSGINYAVINTVPLFNNKPARQVKLTDADDNMQIYDSTYYVGQAHELDPSTVNARCSSTSLFKNIKYEYMDRQTRWQNIIKEEIYKLGLLGTKSYNKFIPEIYKYSSIEDRIDLLRGLMDTDGTIKNSTGEASFTTTSKQLAEDVIELVQSLGGRAVLRSRNRIGRTSVLNTRTVTTRRISYDFTISLPENINPFYLRRKAERHKCKYIVGCAISKIEKIGEKEVQCIEIEHPTHLYITDDYIITHNTLSEKLEPWLVPMRDNFRKLYNKPDKLKSMELDGTIELISFSHFSGRTFDNAVCILDEAQNMTKTQFEMAIGRLGKDSIMIFCGDPKQCYLDRGKISSTAVLHKLESCKKFNIITLTENHRHPAIEEILGLLNKPDK